jgi:hypothetical protein
MGVGEGLGAVEAFEGASRSHSVKSRFCLAAAGAGDIESEARGFSTTGGKIASRLAD